MVVTRDPHVQGRLTPTLGLFTATTLIMGSMIGSGIFRLPANMMFDVRNPGLLLAVWIVGGLVTVCGALTVAELAGMFPRAGGQYQFLKESLGKPWAFLYGWTFFWVVQTGIIAAVAVIFAQFTQRLIGFDSLWVPGLAVLCVVSLTIVNYFGVRSGGRVQDIFTVAKIAALLGLVIFGFLFGHPSHSLFGQTVAGAPTGFDLVSAFFSALLTGLFALDGWGQAALVAPEIKNPTRNVPRAMLLGVASVTIVYVLATAVYLYLVDAATMTQIGDNGIGGPIAAAAAKAFAGETGAKIISAAVMVSTFGTVNAYILTSPRIYYAVAEDRMFPRFFHRLHPTTNAPGTALLVQGIWAGLLVCLGFLAKDAYLALVNATTFCIWLFYVPTAIGYFWLRRNLPDAPRPYRTHFYPVVPAIFLLAGIVVVGNNLYVDVHRIFQGHLASGDIVNLTGIWGTLFALAGVPLVLYWRANARKGQDSPLSDSAPSAAA